MTQLLSNSATESLSLWVTQLLSDWVTQSLSYQSLSLCSTHSLSALYHYKNTRYIHYPIQSSSSIQLVASSLFYHLVHETERQSCSLQTGTVWQRKNNTGSWNVTVGCVMAWPLSVQCSFKWPNHSNLSGWHQQATDVGIGSACPFRRYMRMTTGHTEGREQYIASWLPSPLLWVF